MCDNNPSNLNNMTYTCKPGNGHQNNTDAVCTPNNESNSVLHNSNVITNKGVKLTNCCNNVVNNLKLKESQNYLSDKCLN